MEALKQMILQSRDIKEVSALTYSRDLNRLHKSLFNKNLDNLDFLHDYARVLEELKIFKLSIQKNMLSAIVVSLGCKKYTEELSNKYNFILDDIVQEYENRPKEKITTTMENLHSCLNKLNNILQPYYSEDVIDISDFDRLILNRYLVGSLFVYFPPKYPKYYRYMEIITYDDFNEPIVDNSKKSYLVVINHHQKFFSFYKFGKRNDIRINPKFNEVLNLYLKFHKKIIFIPYKRKINTKAMEHYIRECFIKYNVNYTKLTKIHQRHLQDS